MAMREKVAWLCTVGALTIFGYYFWSAWSDFNARSLDETALLWRFIWCLGIFIAIMLPAAMMTAWAAKQELDQAPDEMERSIERLSQRVGLLVLEALLVIIVLLSGRVADIARSDYPGDPAAAAALILANLVFLAMAVASVLREIVVIVQFRRYA